MRGCIAVLLSIVVTFGPARSAAADEVSDGQWYHQFLNTAQAHQITKGEGVIVAVVDSGIDATHPDLAGSVLPGTDLTAAGDGRVDVDGHGTAMASLIAAHGRVRGVAPAAKVLPVRVGVRAGGGSSKFASAVRFAVANGANVISISSSGEDDLLGRQEIQAAMAADVVVVAAVGNTPATSVGFPAAIPGVVAVAAVDRTGNQADLSVSGEQVVIAVPGVDLSHAYLGGRYAVASGTSGATAITAGAVALIRARFPQMKAPEVVRRLTATATDKGTPGRDPDYGYGVINLMAALTADLPAVTSAPATVTTAPQSGGRPAEPGRFPWWIVVLAVVAVGAVAAGAVMLARRHRGG